MGPVAADNVLKRDSFGSPVPGELGRDAAVVLTQPRGVRSLSMMRQRMPWRASSQATGREPACIIGLTC